MSLNILLILPGVIEYYYRVQLIVIDSSIAIINQYIANVTSFYMRLLLGSINLCHCCPVHLTSDRLVAIDIEKIENSSPLLHLLWVHVCWHFLSGNYYCISLLERMLTFRWNNIRLSWTWWNWWYLLGCWITFSWHVLSGHIYVCVLRLVKLYWDWWNCWYLLDRVIMACVSGSIALSRHQKIRPSCKGWALNIFI